MEESKEERKKKKKIESGTMPLEIKVSMVYRARECRNEGS